MSEKALFDRTYSDFVLWIFQFLVLSDLILTDIFSILRATVCSGAVDGRLFNQEVVGSIQDAVITQPHEDRELSC